MNELRPVDIPALRDETVSTYGKRGQHAYHEQIHNGAEYLIRDGMSPAATATALAQEQTARLRNADLFYVSADMVDLAIAASVSLPRFGMQAEDLPVPTGFMYFAKPIFIGGEDGQVPRPLVAVSWSHWGGSADASAGFWLDWYVDTRTFAHEARRRGEITKAMERDYVSATGRLLLTLPQSWPFGPDVDIPSNYPAEARKILSAVTVLKSAWLLMMQPIAHSESVTGASAVHWRKRSATEPPRVRVITLRRPSGEASGQSDREYHHQWIVRGHWRQHWYPARQVHRPVWIAPHIKGPEGAPMLGGEKVYAWKR